MNCFEWKSHAGDYIEGVLSPLDRNQADAHLDSCDHCRTKLQHVRDLANAIAAQPRQPLPVHMRKAPLAFVPPRAEVLSRKSRWERTPWFIRTSVEGLGIGFLILLLVALLPRMREIYERSLERRMDAFSLIELFRGSQSSDTDASGITPTRGKLRGDELAGIDPVTGGDAAPTADDFAGGENSEDNSEDSSDSVTVGRAEVWRFNIKTESPREMQPKIVSLLLAQGLAKTTPGLGGVVEPGGIQFDLLVSATLIPNLRTQFRKLASANLTANEAQDTMDATGSTATFTWYKNKSKRPIPAGKARIVVWLSQM